MKRLLTVLMAAAFAAACAVDVATVQDDAEAEPAAIELEIPEGHENPEGPGSCAGYAPAHYPGYVVVPVECLEGLRYYYMGDPWVWQGGEPVPDVQAE